MTDKLKYDECVLCKHVRCCHSNRKIKIAANSTKIDMSCTVANCKCQLGIYNLDEYFWKIYLPAHSRPCTKLMHLAGVIATLIYIFACIAYWPIWALLATPFIVYPFAWTSHALIEKNRPLALSNPLYAKASDLLMCFGVITGFLKLDSKGCEQR